MQTTTTMDEKRVALQKDRPLRHLTQLSLAERQRFLDSFDTVFCDCDGVIWHSLHDVIPGAAEAINYLQLAQGKRVKFVTNNSIVSVADQLKKFDKYKLHVDKRDIIYPAQTIVDYLKSINFEGNIYCIGSSTLKKLLRSSGFQVVEARDYIISESVHELRAVIYSDAPPVKAVIVDIDFNLTAAKLMRAHVYLKDPHCLFIAGAADILIPFGGGEIMGPGPFVGVLEQSTKREAVILGKPGKDLCELIKSRFDIKDPQRALFIGDSLTSDIQFGQMCGFQTMLVLSGGTKPEDLLKKSPESEVITPDFVANSLADFNHFISN